MTLHKLTKIVEGRKLRRSDSRSIFTKSCITILPLHPRVPLTNLCVPRSFVVPFPALTLWNDTVIRHTERRNAVFLTFSRKTTTLHDIRTDAKSTKASECIRSTHTSLVDTPTHCIQSMCDQIFEKRQQMSFHGLYELRLSSNSCGWCATVFYTDCMQRIGVSMSDADIQCRI